MDKKTISIASDHAGVILKQNIVNHLINNGYLVKDHGPMDENRVDYPDYAKLVALDVQNNQASCGILVCGSGIGMAITANKFRGVRAASIVDTWSVEMTRKHNDLNVLCLGARVLEKEQAFEIIDIYLKTEFEGGRHSDRLAKIAAFEK
ncbi:MAG: ribose 5-phosphate isomerase B [bacterium]|nr:ribose 5-phosphate isomerase B [bacterium]MBU1917601.1 ribose 5-phosphate isomerase B [bacterium]